MWPEMKQANAKIRKFTETKDNLFYLDTATSMLNAEDQPKPQIFLDDSLHMNEEGYKIWNKIISPYLK
jgi:lysophospholipase L1-like esterase